MYKFLSLIGWENYKIYIIWNRLYLRSTLENAWKLFGSK